MTPCRTPVWKATSRARLPPPAANREPHDNPLGAPRMRPSRHPDFGFAVWLTIVAALGLLSAVIDGRVGWGTLLSELAARLAY